MQLAQQTTPPRVLGIWMLIALVTGNMIGSGIFLLPASLAPYGGLSLVSWLMTTVGALLLAYVFAKLSMFMPKEGGPYAFSRAGFGDFVGFQVAYNYWIAVVVANAATIIAMVAYLTYFWPSLATSPWQAFAITTLTIWLITAINIMGVRQAGMTQLILTIIKVLPLLVLIVMGLQHLNLDHFHLPTTGESYWVGIASGASLTLWAFTGLESATIPAAYAQHPEKTIPRATAIGTLFTAILYILCTVVVMGMIEPTQLAVSNAPFAEAAKQLFGALGGGLMAFVAALSCFSATVGWILLQGQIPMAAAEDGLFPQFFAKVSGNGTPVVGLIVSSVIVTILLLMNFQQSLIAQFTLLVKCSTLAFLIPYLFTCIAKVLLLIKHPIRFHGANLTILTTVAVLAFCYVFWAIFGLGQELIYYGAMLFFTGIPLYVWVKLQQDIKHEMIEIDD